MKLDELRCPCSELFDKVSTEDKSHLHEKAARFTQCILESNQVEHSKAIRYLIYAAHLTHFAKNPEDLKNGYIHAALQFIGRANPPLDYLIYDREYDMAAYLHGWLYHDMNRQFMDRFVSGLQDCANLVRERSPIYAAKLEDVIRQENIRTSNLNSPKPDVA